MDKSFSLECESVLVLPNDRISSDPLSIPTQSHIQDFPHLADVELIELPSNLKQVHVIIGSDLAEGLLPLDQGIRRSSNSTPSAFKSPWGWAILGPRNKSKNKTAHCAFLSRERYSTGSDGKDVFSRL